MSDHVAFTDQPAVRWGAATDVGLVRTGNEDAFVSEPMVFGVADGMGGHQAGEVASEIASRIIRDRLGTGASNVGVVVASVVEANASIYQAAHASADHQGMGTTLTALVVMRADESNVARFALVNVGDSRTYLLRNGELHRATVDHSYVQELVNTGHISEEEARTHPRRNIVTRALGIEPTVRVDTWLVPMVHGDRFILCSDGLVDEVHDDDIAEIALAVADPQLCADRLIAKANANGGRDNVTVVVVDVLQGVEPTAAATDIESEPGWPESESTSTMIDADANSVPTAAGVIVVPGTPVPPVVVVGGHDNAAAATSAWGRGRYLKWLAAATVLVIVAALVGALIYNGVHDDPAPTTTTVAVTEPATTPATVPARTTVAPSSPTTTIVGTSTSGP
ncbi:MAG TPA: Stp1/IreP family PP2C-type Ser/Thr phosphatase [Ilumatobacteraceae bacterium]|nr:Stp1/IreP family PP2C-type Ser/Thr phosphatase [Ilumatobacteraceae bacterium]